MSLVSDIVGTLAESINKGVPGVPLGALDAIADENTRLVLRAVVDGWHVRNGASGGGDNRFITKGELGQVGTQIVGQAVVQAEKVIGGSKVLTPGEISRVINDLQAQVMESLLFKELGTRIDLIDVRSSGTATGLATEITNRTNADNAIVTSVTTQFATVNGNVSALQSAQTTTANNVAALSSDLTTLQAVVGSNTAAIQTEATARVNADNDIYAKYSVKIDTNGYVSGFGLISTANNSAPYSSFIVRANSFAIGSPSGPGITPAVPFIVHTTNQTMADGTVIPPGAYIDYAMVKQLDGAYINAGLLHASKIYTGSQYVDFTSKQDIPAVCATGGTGSSGNTDDPYTFAALRLYGPDYHASVPYNQRVRNTANGRDIPISITANGVIDHYYSLWYRYNGGTWTHIYTLVEPKGGDGGMTISLTKLFSFSNSDYIDFGVSGHDQYGNYFDGGKRYVWDLSMSVTAVNL